MLEKFNQIMRPGKWTSILTVGFGLVLLLWPRPTMEIAVKLLGILLLGDGVVRLLTYLRHRQTREINWAFLLWPAGAEILAGLIMEAFPGFLIGLFPMGVGILLIINGGSSLYSAVTYKKEQNPYWMSSALLSAVTLILGMIALFNPFSMMATTFRVLGVFLLYNGLTSIWMGRREE